MICPHCHETIEDGSRFCLHCHKSIPVTTPKTVEAVFCEGCGARIANRERTCPKCGRPAPGILSSKSAAADLAAGRTSSFPRLSNAQISEHLVKPVGSASHVLSEAADPSETSIISAQGTAEEADSKKKKRRKKVHPDEDAYHKHKRKVPAPLIAASVILALGLGGYWFVTEDPMGVMPEFYRNFNAAAKDAFPQRQVGERGSAANAKVVSALSEDGTASKMSDSVLFGRLESIYDEIVSIGDSDSFSEASKSFNGSYAVTSLADRQAASQGAYDLRSSIQAVQAEIDALNPSDSTAYKEDIEHLRQLAGWLYERIDPICLSWDESLKIADGESVYAHNNDVLAPLRNGNITDAANSYYENVEAWKPEQEI